MGQLELWAEGLAGSGWVYAAMYLFATIDGFFPPIPSESLVIALTALSLSTGSPQLVPLVLAAALGAFCGDQIAYQIGTKVAVRRLRLFRGPRGQAALDRAERALAERGASYVIAARYIPVGRVAVNMTAGALRYRRRRFVVVDAVASLMWAVYSAVIGATAGAVLGANPLVAVAVGVVGGVLLGLAVDQLMQRWAARATGAAAGGESDATPSQLAGSPVVPPESEPDQPVRDRPRV